MYDIMYMYDIIIYDIWELCMRLRVLLNSFILAGSHLLRLSMQVNSASFVGSVQSLSCVQLFVKPWTIVHQASLSITNSWSLLKLMSIEAVMPSTISSSVIPFSSCLQSFPASGFFQMSQFFVTGGQSIGVSASATVLPVNIQGWFPLWWTGSTSLLSKGLLRVFSNTTVQKHQFFSAQLSL